MCAAERLCVYVSLIESREMGLGIYAAWSTLAIEHTFVTTKALNLIYFDGSSAVLTSMGTLDSQAAFLHEQVNLHPGNQYTYDEDQRALDVCERIASFGIDGMMRMDAGFEAMICDRKKSGLKQLATTNVTVPGRGASREKNPDLPRDPHRRPPNGYGSIFAPQSSWEWVRSGTWHYGGYGTTAYNQRETRATLNQCGFVSYYDPRLKSLQGKHHGGLRDDETFEMGWGLRRGHRLLDISKEDATKVFQWTRDAVKAAKRGSIFGGRDQCSGTNWQAITEVITTQHKSRTKEMSSVLRLASMNKISVRQAAERVYGLSHAILHPFLAYPTPETGSIEATKSKAIEGCSSIYTSHLQQQSFNEREALIKDSIEIVLGKLCTWEWDMFEWSDQQTWDLLRNPGVSSLQALTAAVADVSKSEIAERADEAYQMLKYIGWDLWESCDRQCAWNVSASI